MDEIHVRASGRRKQKYCELRGTPVFEASSGNTAASLAYMCNILNVPFTAIVPDTIEEIKVKHIKEYGGDVVKVPLSERLIHARSLAEKNGGFFMNQFGNADKAEEFHESGDFPLESANLFHEIIVQLESDVGQDVKVPHYFVHAAGTGSFTILVFKNESGAGLWVEPGMAGIGYGPMGVARRGETTSMDAAVIDRVVKVPDVAATAAMRILREQGASGGTSSGVNLLTSMHIAATAV
nr:Pyridoxal phosphate-dependent enzyme domain containing protein [Haemonchus contortus]